MAKYLRDSEGIIAFGQRVKEIRLKKQLTQEEVAWEAGIEPMQLSRIERGVINTSISHLLAIAKAIGIHPSELFP
ncbi:MAG: helix-turn-helix transcriptional regulator [Bacteroidia bacterium]|nr:helix-turn-helix transcriptional regulator [Bacteroidia bacterium]